MAGEEDKQVALIDAISVHTRVINDAEYELGDLSDAAAMLGQERIAKRLSNIAEALARSNKVLRDAHGEAVHDTLVRSQEATQNMMAGVLAGIRIAEKQP